MQTAKKWTSIAIVGLAAALLPAVAKGESQYTESSCYDMMPIQSCGRFEFSADILAFKLCRESLAALPDEGGNTPFDFHGTGSYLEHDWDVGFRLTGTWSPEGCSRFAQLEFTCLTMKQSDHATNATGFYEGADRVDTEEDINYQLLDLLFYTYDRQISCTTSLSFLGGVRFLKYNAELSQLFDREFEMVKLNSDSKGVGLVFRLESVKNICEWFDLKGQVGASALCVSRSSKMAMAESDLWDFGKGKKGVGSVEAGLQIAKSFAWGCRDFDLHFGVEATHWIGLGEYPYYADSEVFAFYGESSAFHDQLTLWGFNAGVSFRF